METGKSGVLGGTDEQTDDTGERAGAQDQSAALAPLYEKIERALDGDRPVAALLADLSPETTDALVRQAHAANASRLIGAGSDISLGFQNAPKAFAETGNYSGAMRGPEDFVSVFGAEEGGRQFANFDQQVKAGKQAFAMRAMPERDIQARLHVAAAGASQSPEGQLQYQITAAAVRQVQEARSNDPAGQVSKAFPQVNAAWRAVSDRSWQDPGLVQNALAVTVAAQRYLGIKNIQPVPQSVLKDVGALPPQDAEARIRGLLAEAADPTVKLAMSRQFADAGLFGGEAQAPARDRFGSKDGNPVQGVVNSGQNDATRYEVLSRSAGASAEKSNAPQLTPDQRIDQPFQQDLPADVLIANIAPGVFGNRAQPVGGPGPQGLVNAGNEIALASQAARAAVSGRSAYSGSRPGPEQFAAVFGAEEGGRQFKTFKWRADVSPYLAEMRTMPANQIDALLDIDMPARNPFDPKKAPAQYKREQARYEREKAEFEQKKPSYDLIAGAAAQILQARQNDPAAYVREVFPDVDKAWSQVTKPEDYGAAVARSFAAQRELGIKNIQPLPRSVAEEVIRTWSDSGLTPDAEEAERKLLESISDPKQRSAVAKQFANMREAEMPDEASGSRSDLDNGSVRQPGWRQFAKTIDLSAADILRLKKTLMTEWFVKDGDDEAKGIIDTMLNRLASDHWGDDISAVVNSWAQFSDVNSKNTVPVGRNNVDQLSVRDPRFAKASRMVDEYLLQRAAGAPSIVGDNLNYANPKVSDKANLVWIYKLDGPKLGQHWHGTTDENRQYRPGEFGINLPKDYYPSAS